MIAPDAVALIDERGEGWTYERLSRAVGWRASALHGAGVVAGDRVGIVSTNSVDAVATVFAATTLDAVAVPMNYRATADEFAHLIADSDCRVVAAESRYLDALRGAGTDAVVIELDTPDLADAPPPASVPDDDALAVLLYTSGTTSKPKGVQLTHAALTGYVMSTNNAADGTEQGRMLLAAPLYHVAGLTSLLHSLYSGRTVVVLPQFEAGAWLAAVEQHRVTHAFLVPTMLARVVADERSATADLSSLQALTYGAAPMPPTVIESAIERLPATIDFSGAYGQTETTSTVAVLGPEDHRLTGDPVADELVRQRLRSVGRVVDGVEVHVVDDDGNPVDVDVIGEVHLRTDRTMSGYWGNDEKTRVTVDDSGWVHTGDLGRLDPDDYLFLVGRRGDMVVRGGENISPEEVETVLFECPGVADVGVCGVPDEEWGEQLLATLVLSGSSVDAVREFAREHLAPHKRPADYRVVDELPRTSTGKLLRRALAPG